MPLGTRELLLILRARDEASKVIRGVAAGMGSLTAAQRKALDRQIALGYAVATSGVAIAGMGTAALYWYKKSADMAIEYQRQVAYTRTQIDKVGVSMKTVADIGIRTGRDIGAPFEQLQPTLYDIFSSMEVSIKGAEVLLRGFAKTAVAGQVDVQTAGRATIAIMNAFHIPASKVNEVLDFQFQLVRKGVGTYEEFATTIGRSIPSAARAGQTYKQLGGMLAFLTRNGLSAAMANASAGRALDAISNPKTVEKLRDFGTTLSDALGPDAAKKLGLTAQQLAKTSINVKDASGNFLPMTEIMTRLSRVIGNLPKPERAAVLQQLFKSSGGTIQARRFFDVVLNGNAQLQSFIKLTDAMDHAQGQAGQAFNTMAGTYATKLQLLKNNWQILRIEVGNAVIPVLSKVIGVLSDMLKWWNSLDAKLRANVIKWSAFAAIGAVVVGGVMAIAGAFVALQAALVVAGIGFGFFAGLVGGIVIVLGLLVAGVVLAIKHWGAIKDAFAAVSNWISQHLGPAFRSFIDYLKGVFGPTVKDAAVFFKKLWADVVTWWKQIWPDIAFIVRIVLNVIQIAIRIFSVIFMGFWKGLTAAFPLLWKAAWELIKGVIGGAVRIIMGIIQVFISLLTGDWKGLADGLKLIVRGMKDIIVGIFNAMSLAIQAVIKFIIKFVKGAWDEIINQIKHTGRSMADGIINGFKSINIGKELGKIVGGAVDWVKKTLGIKSPSTVFAEIGKNVVLGLLRGIANNAKNMFGPLVDKMDPSLLMKAGGKAFSYLSQSLTGAGGGVQANKKLALKILQGMGLNREWAAFDFVAMHESGYNNMAQNPTSTAFGIGQFLDSTWASVGMKKTTDAAAQIIGMIKYMIQRYGSITAAAQFWGAHHWYDRGGVLNPGTTVAHNMTGESEFIFTSAQMRALGRLRGGGGNITQNFTINTNEIDPRKHAADLGWELARRVAA